MKLTAVIKSTELIGIKQPYLLGYVLSFDVSKPYKLEPTAAAAASFLYEFGLIHDVAVCYPNGKLLFRTCGYIVTETDDWEFCKNVMMEIAEIIKQKKKIEEGAREYERYTNI